MSEYDKEYYLKNKEKIGKGVKLYRENHKEYYRKYSEQYMLTHYKRKRNNHCNLSIEATHWIDGELLGDAHLRKVSSRPALFSYTSKYLEYIQYVRDTLRSFGIEQSGKINEHKCTKWNSYTYSYCSHSYPELLSIRNEWYPEGKKIIPKGIVLTPLVCRQWYIGDGCLITKNKNYRVLLCTNGFPVSDVEWLVKQLREIGFWAIWQKHNMISIVNKPYKEFNNFLEYIGECPVECYKYKWDII